MAAHILTGRRVAVVGLRRPGEHPWAVDAALEMVQAWLASTGHEVVYQVWQRRRAPAAATYLGSGKALQLRALCELRGISAVVLDGTSTAAQRANLERLLDRPVVDRSMWAPRVVKTPAASRTGALHRRERRHRGARNVVLMGCAGAGKSALFAALTGASPPVQSWPPRPDQGCPLVVTRRLRGNSDRGTVLVTDTPGLIWNPERESWIVPAEADSECREADLILHVVDGSHPDAARRAKHVETLLATRTGAHAARVVPVWTQADRTCDGGHSDPGRWIVSARTGAGCEELIAFLRRTESVRRDDAARQETSTGR